MRIFGKLLEDNIPFAVYKKPDSQSLHFVIPDKLHFSGFPSFSGVKQKSGFVMAPFHPKTGKTKIFLPANRQVKFSLPSLWNEYTQRNEDVSYISDYQLNNKLSDEYVRQFTEYKNNFSPDFNKAILSKIITLRVDQLNIEEYFLRLARHYPGAFVYFVQLSKNVKWLGATPETLIRLVNGEYEIMSLAGTSVTGEWTEKEKYEQQLVSDYIESLLRKFNIVNYRREGPGNFKAGKFYHLLTKYFIPVRELRDSLDGFINELHPTPAVCGYPQRKALDLILKTEKHNREYYAGYTGITGEDNVLDLFVNIRCMKISGNDLFLYAGGGITPDSELEPEWLETELKAGTLLNFLF